MEEISVEANTESYTEQRTRELQEYSEKWNRQLYPYPEPVTRENLQDYRHTYKHLTDVGGQVLEDTEERISGRIVFKRTCGKKLAFYEIEKNGVTLQILANFKYYQDKNHFNDINGVLKRGDIVYVHGHPGSSNPKNHDPELSIIPLRMELQSPCMHELPCNEGGFSDTGLRFQKRYLDMILRPSVRNTFKIRAKVIECLRDFLVEREFVEVETPILTLGAHGASAKPFKTKHNELDLDMYLRIAPELFLKKLIIGGFSRVFEIGKLFRNEGIDMTHNPEFTSCEFYMIDEDYNGLMTLTEQLLVYIAKNATGSHTVTVDDQQISFEGPYDRIDFMDGLRQYAGFNLPLNTPIDSPQTYNHLVDLLEQHNIECSPKTIPKMMDKLCSEFVEPRCIQPTFIMNHPAIMSPLAKQHRNNPQLTERFELFVNGRELCNAYTELNDPRIQQLRFEEQQLQKDDGDDEVQIPDSSFVSALEYGLPPTAGWGMGIDRLVMLLTNNDSIKEVLTFPHTKVEK